MSSDSIRFRLKKDYTRVQVAVQELEHDVVLTGDDVYEATEPSVIKALESHSAVVRVPVKEKGGESA